MQCMKDYQLNLMLWQLTNTTICGHKIAGGLDNALLFFYAYGLIFSLWRI